MACIYLTVLMTLYSTHISNMHKSDYIGVTKIAETMKNTRATNEEQEKKNIRNDKRERERERETDRRFASRPG